METKLFTKSATKIKSFQQIPFSSIFRFEQNWYTARSSVADPDPGSGAFLTPGSGIRNRFFPDPGSQTHTFESLVTIF
jgi:hypothetical protein